MEKSITGFEYNNPKICIRNSGSTFACVCKECMDEYSNIDISSVWDMKSTEDRMGEPKESNFLSALMMFGAVVVFVVIMVII